MFFIPYLVGAGVAVAGWAAVKIFGSNAQVATLAAKEKELAEKERQLASQERARQDGLLAETRQKLIAAEAALTTQAQQQNVSLVKTVTEQIQTLEAKLAQPKEVVKEITTGHCAKCGRLRPLRDINVKAAKVSWNGVPVNYIALCDACAAVRTAEPKVQPAEEHLETAAT